MLLCSWAEVNLKPAFAKAVARQRRRNNGQKNRFAKESKFIQTFGEESFAESFAEIDSKFSSRQVFSQETGKYPPCSCAQKTKALSAQTAVVMGCVHAGSLGIKIVASANFHTQLGGDMISGGIMVSSTPFEKSTKMEK